MTTARDEVEAIWVRTVGAMAENPGQQLAIMMGDESANLNKINAHNAFVRESILALADRIDALER